MDNDAENDTVGEDRRRGARERYLSNWHRLNFNGSAAGKELARRLGEISREDPDAGPADLLAALIREHEQAGDAAARLLAAWRAGGDALRETLADLGVRFDGPADQGDAAAVRLAEEACRRVIEERDAAFTARDDAVAACERERMLRQAAADAAAQLEADNAWLAAELAAAGQRIERLEADRLSRPAAPLDDGINLGPRLATPARPSAPPAGWFGRLLGRGRHRTVRLVAAGLIASGAAAAIFVPWTTGGTTVGRNVLPGLTADPLVAPPDPPPALPPSPAPPPEHVAIVLAQAAEMAQALRDAARELSEATRQREQRDRQARQEQEEMLARMRAMAASPPPARKPAGAAAAAAARPAAEAGAPTAFCGPRTHLADIRMGETLARAAQRLGVRLDRLYELNPLLEPVPPDQKLTEGQVCAPNDL